MSQKYITVLKYVILEKLQKLAKITKHVSTRQTNVPKNIFSKIMCIKPVGTIDHSTYKYVVWYVVIPNFMILVGITMDKPKTCKGGSFQG